MHVGDLVEELQFAAWTRDSWQRDSAKALTRALPV